jgi:glycerate 2-kinase
LPDTDLRAEALRLFRVGLKAADPGAAVTRPLLDFSLIQIGKNGRYIVVSVGKAAIAMAEAALPLLISAPVEALVVTNYENARDLAGARVMAAGHPVPDAAGEAAGRAVEALLATAGAQDRIIALISGGGSALLPAPVEGVTLEEKAEVNRLLLANGFEITEMNAVRQHLSRLKGGGMLRVAAPAPVTALILSDVIGDDLRVIASGPTVARIAARAQVVGLLRDRGLWARLPASVQAHLMHPKAARPLPAARNILIGSNRLSLEAMLAAAGQGARIASDHLTGDVADACAEVIAAARSVTRPACLIFGGETTVTIHGTGRGGRNQELALRVAMAGLPGRWAFLSGGTDGRDGPTDAAGGLVDQGTMTRMGRDVAALLANNDSYAALEASGDLIRIPATGTNVADVQVLLLG